MPNITIVDLELHLRIGITESERAKPQRILMTVDMECDFTSAAVTDRITKTIDYFQVSQHLLKLGEGRSWNLIEKLASDAADLVLTKFQPEAVTIVVKKFPIPQAAFVSATLTKQRT